ncbi:beta-lactamase class A [Quadrisphaera sp. DSM 44207]|nr:class A beta-lactamase [Quadrisphaera sp. DSM 44207]SDQ21467.1 beta-lactamase class A [Quadrisphaera sp. DSM 44207]
MTTTHPPPTSRPGRAARAGVAAVLALIPLTGCSATGQPADPPAATASSSAAPSAPSSAPASAAQAAFAQLEADHDARLGVYALDTGSGRSVEHRADERFAHASTYKALAAAAVLERTSSADLERVVPVTDADLVTHSPIAEQRAGTGMTLREVADAAIRYSDNTAGNLLLRELGGPDGFERSLRSLGDAVTDPERLETDLNEAVPGDVRDTSTPRALATDLHAYAVGDALPEDDRALLTGWLRENTTGDALVRAGAPAGWVVGDKTGAGGYGTRNDIAVLWPPSGDPVVLAVLSSRDEPDADHDDALVADATRVALAALTG